MKLSVGKKLTIIFSLGLLCLAVVGYLLYSNSALQAALRSPRLSDHTTQKTLDSLRSGLTDIEAAELRYALSGDKSAIESASDALLHSLKDLKVLFAYDTDRLRDLARLDSLIAQRLQFTEQVITARKRGNSRKAADAMVRRDAAKPVTEQITVILNELEQAGITTNARENRMLSQGFRNGIFLMFAGYVVALAILLLSIAVIRRAFVRHRMLGQSVRNLRKRVRLFTEGFKDSAMFTLGPKGKISQWNAAAERLHGFRTNEVLGKDFGLLFPTEDIPLGKPEHGLKRAEEDGYFEHIGWRLRKDGSLFQAHTIITPIRDQNGPLQGFSIVTRDVTALRQTEELLKKLSLTVEQAADLIVITDRNGKVEFVNKAVEEVTGFTRDEIFAGGMNLLLLAKEQDEKPYRELWDTVLSGQTFQAEMTGTSKNEELIHLDEVVTPIKDKDGKVSHVVFTGTDITPIKLMRNKLDFLASYDALTGLPNRDLFADRLSRDLARVNANRRPFAVLAIDIDRFKYINEIYGLESGNKVLKQVAESLSVSVSKGDTVGRMGSDEFGILLHDIKRPADVVLFVKMIMKNIPQIVMSGGEEISVTLTAGIAVYPTDGQDALKLIKNADTALSKAKALGRNHYQFYTPDMNVGISELVFMERRLSDALRNKEYILTFQPYYYLSTVKVAGAEALLKWNNEEFGQVSPAKFIPMLEETGMIIDVGRWALTTACKQIKEWTNGKGLMPVSVNLSPNQFRHEYLVEMVENAIQETGINPQRLILEVTESTFMKNQDFAISVLKRLKDLGVSIAIDDFGTGYSSLSYLKKFPVDYVKIDQSFVKDVATDPDTTSLVTAIITMAHSLNLKTIAEGVETEEQGKILRLLKCDMGQGYYFCAALTPKDFEKLLR